MFESQYPTIAKYSNAKTQLRLHQSQKIQSLARGLSQAFTQKMKDVRQMIDTNIISITHDYSRIGLGLRP